LPGIRLGKPIPVGTALRIRVPDDGAVWKCRPQSGAQRHRGADGLPRAWLELMKRAMSTTIWRFSTTRMLHEYVDLLYLPAAGVEPVAAAGRRRVVTEAG